MAETVFLAQGFADTTMRDVAARAGASTETLYRHFGSKEDLFAEVVTNRARCLEILHSNEIDNPIAIGDVLRKLGNNLLTMMTSPEVTSLLRIVIAESDRDPEIGRIFLALGPEHTRQKLTEFLELARAKGDFFGDDAALAATIFLGAVTSHTHTMRLVLRDAPLMTAVEIETRVNEVVAMFMAHYGMNRSDDINTALNHEIHSR